MNELLQILEAGESASIEFKTSLSDWKKVVETIAAIATVGGGLILVGVRPDGSPVGIELSEGSVEQFIQRVLNNTDPRVYVSVDQPRVEGVRLLRVVVPPGDGPHLAFGRAFHRPGPATVQMSRDEYERRLLDRLRESAGFERRAAPECTFDDISPAAIRHFVAMAEPRGAVGGEPSQVLAALKLTAGGLPSVGAILLFGREPQAPLPQAVIRGRSMRGAMGAGDTLAAEDVLAAEGTLFEQIEETIRFVARNLRVRAVISGTRREELPEVPLTAVREAVINAVVHRDYRSTAPIQIRIDDSTIEIWNPGHLPDPLTPASLREPHPSVPPNPLLARCLYRAGYIEEWGSGTLRIIEDMRAAGNPGPTFSEWRGGIQVMLPFIGTVPSHLNERQSTWLASIAPSARFRTRDYAARFNITSRTALADLRGIADYGLIESRGKGAAAHWQSRNGGTG
ncbi:MAG: ATP-dependent DNA helicase RecG [Myxococcota bacterium]